LCSWLLLSLNDSFSGTAGNLSIDPQSEIAKNSPVGFWPEMRTPMLMTPFLSPPVPYLRQKFSQSRRKTYYLMVVHEHLLRIPKPEPKVGLEAQHITLCSNLGHDAEENLITRC
jgi:hypothetical protein